MRRATAMRAVARAPRRALGREALAALGVALALAVAVLAGQAEGGDGDGDGDGDDGDFAYDSPLCDRYGFREKGRHAYAYCKYSFGEAASAHLEEYQAGKRACEWESVERGAIQTTYASYEERVLDTPYSYDMFNLTRFPHHKYEPTTVEKCRFSTSLGDVFVERAPFRARRRGQWEQIHMHILEDIDLEHYDHHFKGTLLVASYASGEILLTPPVHYHHSHLFAAYDRTNMQLPHYDTTETHGDAGCARADVKYGAQCLWNLNPPGYYNRISPTLMRDPRVEWFFDFWGFPEFTSEGWRGFGFNGDINLIDDIPFGAVGEPEADGLFWEFAMIMRRPEERERHRIVDTLNIGPQFTLTPFQRAGTYSVPYDQPSVIWGTFNVCDNALLPCEVSRFKFHAHDGQELWIYEGSVWDLGLWEVENFYGCSDDEEVGEGENSYPAADQWLYPFRPELEWAGGSRAEEQRRCEANVRKYPKLSFVPVGLRSFKPAERGTSLEAVQANIRRHAAKSGARLLWELKREQGAHGTQDTRPLAKYSFGPGAQITMIAFTRPGRPGEETIGDHRKHFELYLRVLRPQVDDTERRYWEAHCIPCEEMTAFNSGTCMVMDTAPPMLECAWYDRGGTDDAGAAPPPVGTDAGAGAAPARGTANRTQLRHALPVPPDVHDARPARPHEAAGRGDQAEARLPHGVPRHIHVGRPRARAPPLPEGGHRRGAARADRGRAADAPETPPAARLRPSSFRPPVCVCMCVCVLPRRGGGGGGRLHRYIHRPVAPRHSRGP